MKPPAPAPKAKPKPAPKRPAQKVVPGVEPGDHVYVEHPEKGAMAVRVLSAGKDGFLAECNEGGQHGCLWDSYRGHKSRQLKQYAVVDQGADGALVQDGTGRRRYLAGDALGKAEPGPKTLPGQATAPADDPLTGGLDKLRKALQLDPPSREDADVRLPDDATILLLKAGTIANRPGLSLQDRAGKSGRHAKRWVRTNKDQPATPGRSNAQPPADKPVMGHGASVAHGDTVAFRHGDVGGEGKVVGSGADGVTLEDKEGKQHKVRHEHLVTKQDGQADGPAEPERGGEGGGAGGGGDGTVPPDSFKASSVYAEYDDPNVTPEQVVAQFPPDTAGRIDAVQKKIASAGQTVDRYRKDGTYTPERQALHETIIAKFMSPKQIVGATPADGQAPTFTILGGRGGSGKSWFEHNVYDPEKAITLDADAIKAELPEYQGWNASEVHEESGDIFDRMTDLAKSLGLNLVHDATMKTGPKAVALVKGFKDSGYRAEAHYMFLPRQEAAKRAVGRFLGPTGRFVPPSVVLQNTGNETSFDQVKGLVDAWSFRNNNVAKGEPPKLLSEKKDAGLDAGGGGAAGRHGLPSAQEPGGAGQDRGGRPGPHQEGDSGAGGKKDRFAKALQIAGSSRIILFAFVR